MTCKHEFVPDVVFTKIANKGMWSCINCNISMSLNKAYAIYNCCGGICATKEEFEIAQMILEKAKNAFEGDKK